MESGKVQPRGRGVLFASAGVKSRERILKEFRMKTIPAADLVSLCHGVHAVDPRTDGLVFERLPPALGVLYEMPKEIRLTDADLRLTPEGVAEHWLRFGGWERPREAPLSLNAIHDAE